MALLHLLVATQNHYTGRLDEAMHYYSAIPTTAGDTYTLSLLNKCIILRAGTAEQRVLATKLLDEAELRLMESGQTTSQLRNALLLLRGISGTELLKFRYLPHTPHTAPPRGFVL